MPTGDRLTSSVPQFDEVFHDSGWSQIPKDELVDCANFFDADPNVETGFNFRLDALLNGGIIFKRKGKSMTGMAKEWMSHEFSRFLKEVVRSWWYAGFAACLWEEHPIFGGRPCVLDLTQITVRYKFTLSGTPIARYFFQPQNGTLQEVEIKNVLTFWNKPPLPNGNLRSLVKHLSQDHIQETILTYYNTLAVKGRALPVMITGGIL